VSATYYFSTHGCSLVCSSFPSVGFGFELPDAAAAARALLLKKLDAILLSQFNAKEMSWWVGGGQ
jgi:hypothetical protein